MFESSELVSGSRKVRELRGIIYLAVLPPELKAKSGRRIEKTTTSKGLMHSSDHIKENWATIEGGSTPLYPPLGETLYLGYICTYVRISGTV